MHESKLAVVSVVDKKQYVTKETIATVLSCRLDDLGAVVLAALFSGLQSNSSTCLFTETIFLWAPPKYMGIRRMVLMT